MLLIKPYKYKLSVEFFSYFIFKILYFIIFKKKSKVIYMSYENKYLKYKLKYLKLSLSLQKGGRKEQINWPMDFKRIDVDNKLEFISFTTTTSIEDNASDYKKKLNTLLSKNPIGKVTSVSDKEIVIKLDKITDNLTEVRFNITDFPLGIKFKKDIPDTENNKVVRFNPDKNDQVIGFNPNKNDQVIGFNPNEFRIMKLETKIAEIEKRLTNHYHILPTSGMKDFEESHPYYNKKIN